ncbi:unnamed protein product [Paramecium sonneborni]|uniref:Uncharacterized protein n=1 Tax=Paramecium sonneborni TaxID=65129 RepID=A0A8S1RUZ6_9CILI|nr:unnamed protein product [Paramecium sonneborni]
MFKQRQDFCKVVANDFLGGPKIIKQCHRINIQKGLAAVLLFSSFGGIKTFLQVLISMQSYGLQKISHFQIELPEQNYDWLINIYVIAWLEISDGIPNPSNGRVVTAIFAYVSGVVLMIVSDCQKYYTLKYKQGLIMEGMFKYGKNPNYTGENYYMHRLQSLVDMYQLTKYYSESGQLHSMDL